MKAQKCICPLCEGSGKILVPVRPHSTDLKKAAKKLRERGFTIREIASTLGYKNPGSITNLLKS